MKVIINSTIKNINIRPGHKCFKLKTSTDGFDISIVTKMEHADGLYCSALNIENAIKKFNKMLGIALDKYENKYKN
jgi:hypothetical protein